MQDVIDVRVHVGKNRKTEQTKRVKSVTTPPHHGSVEWPWEMLKLYLSGVESECVRWAAWGPFLVILRQGVKGFFT